MTLSKKQQEHLLGIGIGALAVMAALWFLVATAKQDELKEKLGVEAKLNLQVSKAEDVIRHATEYDDTLRHDTESLSQREQTFAPDTDPYAWIIRFINTFITSRNVNIQPTQPEIGIITIVPNFPYKTATFHMKGQGYYHDFGKFFADFENTYPYFQIRNIDISLNPGTGFAPEKLGFAFDIVTPVISSTPDTK